MTLTLLAWLGFGACIILALLIFALNGVLVNYIQAMFKVQQDLIKEFGRIDILAQAEHAKHVLAELRALRAGREEAEGEEVEQ